MSFIDNALQTADETRAIDLGPGAVDRTGAMFAELFPGQKALLVADENTYGVAGPQVAAALVEAGVEVAEDALIFPGTPTLYADYNNVKIIRDRLRGLDDTVICSIAAGTLNDLAKLASGELGRPYLNVCTAASVDGYSAFGASITRDGFKITRACPAPAGLIADTDIMSRAPVRLTATGYGDLIEKIPAGADWILADELGLEPIEPDVWKMVQGGLREVLESPHRIADAEPAAVEGLLEAHLLSGLAMQAIKSSRPASGAGHQFSHTWEMEGHGLDIEPPLSHGFKVAVGTVASCALWEEALRLDTDALDIEQIVAHAPTDAEIVERVRAALPAKIAESAIESALAKNLVGEPLRQRVASIKEVWPTIRSRAGRQLITAETTAEMLQVAGAPYDPRMIGISLERLRKTYFTAQMIRTRYTVLDVLADLGLLEAAVSRLFAPDGFWGEAAADARRVQ